MNDNKLLAQAAHTAPNDTLYVYMLACSKVRANFLSQDDDYTAVRPLLERALEIDPNYLPALYAYAMTKPAHAQQMDALNHLAEIDSNNALPYYLMAFEEYETITKDRKVTKASNFDACDLTQAEWQSA